MDLFYFSSLRIRRESWYRKIDLLILYIKNRLKVWIYSNMSLISHILGSRYLKCDYTYSCDSI